MEQAKRMQLGSDEKANLNAVLDFYLDKGKKGDLEAREKGLMLCGNLWMFWHIRGKNISSNEIINAFFSASDDMSPSLGKCMALMPSVVAYWITGDFKTCLEKAVLQNRIAISLDNKEEIVKSFVALTMANLMSNLEESLKYSEESITIAESYGDPYWIACVLYFNGIANSVAGDLAKAGKSFTKSLEYIRRTGDEECKGGALSGLAMVSVKNEEVEKGLELYNESLVAFNKVGDRAEIARVLSEMSWVLIAKGDTIRAKDLTLESITEYQAVGSTRGIGIALIALAAIESIEGRPYESVLIAVAADRYAEQEGIVNDYGYSSQDRSYLDKAKNSLEKSEYEKAIKEGNELGLSDLLDLAKRNLVAFA